MSEPIPSETGTDFANLINNNPYRFRVGLYSADGRYQELRIGAISRLVIEDSFTDFYHKGYIVINNSFDAVERIADFNNQQKLLNVTSSSITPEKGFIFKGDSRDILSVDIMPKLDEETYSFNNNKDAEKAFALRFNFAVYDYEEVLGDKPGEKFKKLYFWDMYNELLNEKNSYFSTSNYVNGEINDLTNAERGIPTGIAIKRFLEEFFKDEDGWPITVDEQKFEEGESTIFFSSPSRFKGIDCLRYLLNRHVSSADNNYDKAFLRIERNSFTFTLQSLNTYFKSALNGSSNNKGIGEYYLETFKLGTYADSNVEDIIVERTNYVPQNSMFLDKYGTINNFSYDPMPGIYTQQNLVSVKVHGYNSEDKCFFIDETRNSINSTMSAYDQNYVLPFQAFSFDKAYRNYFPGDYRQQQKNVKNVNALIEQEDEQDANQRLASGRNTALNSSVFLNDTIVFTVPGSTHRQAGRFVGVTRDGAFPYSDFDNKILGIYLVLEVKHVFTGNEYFNELRCVKTYSYDSLFLNLNSR